jgi:hypothetical protein
MSGASLLPDVAAHGPPPARDSVIQLGCASTPRDVRGRASPDPVGVGSPMISGSVAKREMHATVPLRKHEARRTTEPS